MAIILGTIGYGTRVEDLIDVSKVSEIITSYANTVEDVLYEVSKEITKLKGSTLREENLTLSTGQTPIIEALDKIINKLDIIDEVEAARNQIVNAAKERFFAEADELENKLNQQKEVLGDMIAAVYEKMAVINGETISTQKDREAIFAIKNELEIIGEKQQKLAAKRSETEILR